MRRPLYPGQGILYGLPLKTARLISRLSDSKPRRHRAAVTGSIIASILSIRPAAGIRTATRRVDTESFGLLVPCNDDSCHAPVHFKRESVMLLKGRTIREWKTPRLCRGQSECVGTVVTYFIGDRD